MSGDINFLGVPGREVQILVVHRGRDGKARVYRLDDVMNAQLNAVPGPRRARARLSCEGDLSYLLFDGEKLAELQGFLEWDVRNDEPLDRPFESPLEGDREIQLTLRETDPE